MDELIVGGNVEFLPVIRLEMEYGDRRVIIELPANVDINKLDAAFVWLAKLNAEWTVR